MRISRIFVLLAVLSIAVSCGEDNVETEEPAVFDFIRNPELTFSPDDSGAKLIQFKTNRKWEIEAGSIEPWLSVTPSCGEPGGSVETFTLEVTVSPITDGISRSSVLKIKSGDNVNQVAVTQKGLHECTEFDITDGMIFSTTLGKNITNVAQGFDYDPVDDIVYITQKYGIWRNHIGWQKRETNSGTEAASDYMLLKCFSHGNNVWIERTTSGSRYLWTPNYGTRQSDGSYDKPKIVSRLPLVSGKSVANTETTENYYFGFSTNWPAFDFANDMIAVCDIKNFYVYRLSEIMVLPDTEITLNDSITYGGTVGDAKTGIPEFTGQPVVKARDCRNIRPLYTVPFDYGSRGLHWQTYCIDNGWIYALLEADLKDAPEIIFDTYVEAYKMDGTKNFYKIRQEYMQNRDRILEFGWTDKDYFYCEPEGIKVMGNTMLVMYAIKHDSTHPDVTRRPVIFKVANPVAENLR